MDKRTKYPLLGFLLASALLGPVAAQALAADDDEGFPFHLEPLIVEPFFTDVDTNSSKFDEYTDRSDGVVLRELNLSGQSSDTRRVFKLLARNIAREDERWTMSYGRSGKYRLSLDFNRIVHRFGNDGTLLWGHTAPGVYSISDSTQQALQDAIAAKFAAGAAGVNFRFLDGLLAPYIAAATPTDLKLRRDRLNTRLDLGKMGKLAWTLDVSHENRKGTRPYGASLGFSNASELPEPIDYDTFGAGLSGQVQAKRAVARFGYRFSSFKNAIESLTWDNVFRITDSTNASAYAAPGAGSIAGPATGRNALAPDNRSHQFFLNGRTDLGSAGHASVDLSYRSMTQDSDLLPYSTNSSINAASGAPFDVTDAGNLPQQSPDRSVSTLALNARAGWRFGRKVALEAWTRYDRYDDRSDRIEFPGYVRFDAVWEPIGRITVPYEFRRLRLGGDLSWRFARGSSLKLGYERRSMDRDRREVAEVDEDVLTASFDTRALDWLNLRASFERGVRSTSEYLVEAQEESFTHPEGPNNNPDLRKFDEAARTFNAGRLLAIVTPGEKFDFTLGFTARKDDYDESVLGLLEDRVWSVDGELSWTPRPDITMGLFAGRIDRESFQRGRQSGATPSSNPADGWDLTLTERTDLVGLSLDATFAQFWNALLRVEWSKADGNSDFFSPPGGSPDAALGFASYDDNEFLTLRARLTYRIDEHFTAGLSYARERYTADRFARDGLKAYLPATLLLNANDGDFAAHLLAAHFRIRF